MEVSVDSPPFWELVEMLERGVRSSRADDLRARSLLVTLMLLQIVCAIPMLLGWDYFSSPGMLVSAFLGYACFYSWPACDVWRRHDQERLAEFARLVLAEGIAQGAVAAMPPNETSLQGLMQTCRALHHLS